jgi:hypothetical protein
MKKEDIDIEVSNSLFDTSQAVNEETSEKLLDELLDVGEMKEIIRTRDNLSAPGNDYLINPVIQLERKSAIRMMIAMMRTILNSGMYSEY